ncbi:GNAT family N-acetyltransferase [bacterium]|nr:MAG: GNAT family N-acetyltransferase [bacterium]
MDKVENTGELEWVIQDSISPEDARRLDEVIEERNLEQTGTRRAILVILVRNSDGEVVAGALGTVAWGLLYIKTLSVTAPLQGQGYGAKLLAAIEDEAKRRGVRVAHLHTMGFQAPAFYEKYGYSVFQVLEGTSDEHKRYFLKKEL